MTRSAPTLLLALSAVLFSGCASFDREWRLWSPKTTTRPKGTVAVLFPKIEPAPTPQSPWDGRWVGRWKSERHRAPFSRELESGDLRCIFTRIDPYRYRAHFRANWLLGATDYQAELYGQPRGRTLHLKGQFPVSRIFGGTYRYEGTVTPDRFALRYDSSYDTGTFEMRKVR